MCSSTDVGYGRRHVAQLIQTLTMGGAERLAVQIANARAEAGDAAFLYVLTDQGILSDSIDPRVKVHYLHQMWSEEGGLLRILPAVIALYRRLARLVRQDGIELIQTHLPAANYLGLLLTWRRRCAVVGTIHNNQEFRYGHDVSTWRARLRQRAYRSLVRRCDAVVTVSADVRDSLVRDLRLGASEAEKLAIVPNGVPMPAQLPAAELLGVRQRYGCKPAEPLVVGAGRLTSQKNFEALIEAAASMLRQHVSFRVLVAGDGPLRGDLQARIDGHGLSERFRLLGNITDLATLLQAADLFVLPSAWEGLPLVLLEAMASGLPVVATAIEGVSEVVTDGESGLLVPPGDSGALASALTSLLADPVKRESLGAAGRQVVARDHSFESTVQRLDSLYRRILAPPAGVED